MIQDSRASQGGTALNPSWRGFLPPHAIVMAVRRSNAPGKIPHLPGTRDSLEKIAQDLAARAPCGNCASPLALGVGNPQAQLIFVGEGPGAFEGPAGQLLDKMIEALGLKREFVYLCSVASCPSCNSLLERQIDVIQPKAIVGLGETVSRNLLQTQASLSGLRGNFHPYRGAQLMPSFQPADLLLKPELKREAWEDLRKVAKEIGIQIPGKK